jgi:hypothetical protein
MPYPLNNTANALRYPPIIHGHRLHLRAVPLSNFSILTRIQGLGKLARRMAASQFEFQIGSATPAAAVELLSIAEKLAHDLIVCDGPGSAIRIERVRDGVSVHRELFRS